MRHKEEDNMTNLTKTPVALHFMLPEIYPANLVLPTSLFLHEVHRRSLTQPDIVKVTAFDEEHQPIKSLEGFYKRSDLREVFASKGLILCYNHT
jgi:hypothetical protein